jgi:hypothetical protein
MGILRLAAACFMAITGALAATAGAEASTLYTFNFTQDGYVSATDPDYTGVLTGSFSGTTDNVGTMGLGQLTDFSSTFTMFHQGSLFTTDSINGVAALAFFTYKPGNTPSTLGIATLFSVLKSFCVGAPAAFGACGPTGNVGAVTFPLGSQPIFRSSNGPQIALISATPIPAALPLLAASIGALSLFGWRRSEKRA